MKSTLVLVVAFAAVVLGQKYTDKYDGINYKEIVSNDRLLDGYVKCLLDKGPCVPEGKELKSHVGDALETGCSKCTPVQQQGTKDVISHLIHNKPDIWTQLKQKYDPKGIYTVKYENEYKKL